MGLDERAFVNLLSTSPIIPKYIYKKRFTTLIGTSILSFGTKEQEVVLLVNNATRKGGCCSITTCTWNNIFIPSKLLGSETSCANYKRFIQNFAQSR